MDPFGRLVELRGRALVAAGADDPASVAAAVASVTAELIGQLSPDEEVGLLSGDGALVAGTRSMATRYNGEPIVAGEVARLGIPGIRFTDGPRGIVMYRSTAFPTPMARAATFDVDLEAQIGDAIGVEARAQGANLFAGVCINLLRHPAWGRAQETYGEDSHLLGEMGAALVRGSQRHVMAGIKHFAANSMENSRLWLDVHIADEDLRDLYLPHFRRCVDEGAAAVMTAYNKVNGVPCGHHHRLITEILKGEWGFTGFVLSDFTWGVRGARAPVLAGMDLEMPYEAFFKRLRGLVRRGRVPASRIDDAVARLVGTQVRFATVGEPERYVPSAVAGPEHRALARAAAARSLVLLRNDTVAGRGSRAEASPVLPIDPARTGRVSVVGWLAAEANLGDLGSSQVHPPSVVTLLEGIEMAGERLGVAVDHHDGRDLDAAAAVAKGADACVAVVGTSFRDEGEWIIRAGGDRSSLRLHEHDEALVAATVAANPRTVVVLMGGSAFVTDTWVHQPPALVMAWYPGMEGGHAVADVLFGDEIPGGRLPCTWPSSANALPPFRRFARTIRYGPLHGYRLLAAQDRMPAFWFGHGLGYGTATWSPPEVVSVETADDGSRTVRLSVAIDNDTPHAVHEVVQAYAREPLGTEPRPLDTLRAFRSVRVEAGAGAVIELEVRLAAKATALSIGRSADPAGLVEVALPDR